jgi:hypothetical protein
MRIKACLAPLLLVLAACDPPAPEGCSSRADCASGMACLDGRCVVERDAPPAIDAPADAPCVCPAGQSCAGGLCAADCGDPRATPCAAGDACDFATGRCVAGGTAGALVGEGERCGEMGPRCLPGTECSVTGTCQPAPPCVALRCTEDGATCWGASCASTRRTAPCSLPSLERLNTADFVHGGDNGLVDLEFDDACNAYGVTTISGTDFLRELAPDGTLVVHPGVTNLNMGEVAVLRPYSSEFEMEPGEVALTYTCCLSCGCVGGDPQGVARLDRMGAVRLPMVLTAAASDASGPFGIRALDGGPFGLTWGRDRTLYVGNVAVDGDVHRADLAAGTSGEIARLEGRVHAASSFDGRSLLVAIAGGRVVRLAVDGSSTVDFADVGQDVTSLVRDPFLGVVYVSRRDGSVVTLDAGGLELDELVPAGGRPGRLAYGPDGDLYYLRTGFPVRPTIERIALPATR